MRLLGAKRTQWGLPCSRCLRVATENEELNNTEVLPSRIPVR